MTDRLQVYRMYKWWGGSFWGPIRPTCKYYVTDHWKSTYCWELNIREEVINLISLIKPYMCKRRRNKIDLMLETHKENPRRVRLTAEHGTYSMYAWHQCRCPLCMDAYRLYRKQLKIRQLKCSFEHGTYYGYANRGCRCSLCKEAGYKYNLGYRLRHDK